MESTVSASDSISTSLSAAMKKEMFSEIVRVRVVLRKTVGGSQNQQQLDDHAKHITDTPGFKPFTLKKEMQFFSLLT